MSAKKRTDVRGGMDRMRAEARTFQLAEVRREQELTQQDAAGSMGVSMYRVA